jgi:hypothetical protein
MVNGYVRHADATSAVLRLRHEWVRLPPMNHTDWRPSARKPVRAAARRGPKVTVGVKAYGGKQVQRLGSHWADPTRSNGLLEQ